MQAWKKRMLMIPTQIKPSPINGLGIFTILPIPKGTVVWRYCEPVDYRLEEVSDEIRDFIRKYAYVPKGKKYFEVPGDGALFMNHSNEPNVICRKNDDDDVVAARDIAAGEELTSNYFEFDENPESGGKLNNPKF